MKILTYEGIVENGSIHVLGGVSLPEKAKVYVICPDIYEVEIPPTACIRSPRLSNPEQASHFVKEVYPE